MKIWGEFSRICLIFQLKNPFPFSIDNDSLSALQSALKSDILVSQPNMFEDLQGLGDAIEIKKHVDTIKDQVKYLKTAVEHAIELNKDKIPSNVNGKLFLIFLPEIS